MEKTNNLLNEYREQFKLLAKKVNEIDTVQGDYPRRDRERMIEFSARRLAIEKITEWMEELFGIKRGDWEAEITNTKDEMFKYISDEVESDEHN